MASTFAELFSDYQNAIKVYTEELDFTEIQFMRDFTRGMQKFQRETEYVQWAVWLNRDANGNFVLPQELLRIVEIRDDCGDIILGQEYNQFVRNVDKYTTGKLETPYDYTIRTDKKVLYSSPNLLPLAVRNLPNTLPQFKEQRMWAVYNRIIFIFPPYNGNVLLLRYIPDIHAFSSNSPQWTAWFTGNQFENLFRTSRVVDELAPYEDSFTKYAIMEYIRSKGSVNYRVFENEFWAEVERAKINKPLYFQEGVREYFFAPYS